MKKVSNSGCIPNSWYRALNETHYTNVILCKVLKSGKLGKPQEYVMYGAEHTAEDVINRLETLNPDQHWLKA